MISITRHVKKINLLLSRMWVPEMLNFEINGTFFDRTTKDILNYNQFGIKIYLSSYD